MPGRILRVLPTGRKIALVRYRVDGKDRRFKLGQLGFRSVTKAEIAELHGTMRDRPGAAHRGASSSGNHPRRVSSRWIWARARVARIRRLPAEIPRISAASLDGSRRMSVKTKASRRWPGRVSRTAWSASARRRWSSLPSGSV
jgi:hypothetical protein